MGLLPVIVSCMETSEEGFIKDLGWFTDLKIRGSWGITGNQAIAPYATLASLTSTENNYPYQGGSTSNVGYGINRAANPNLKWETTKQTDIGLDLALFTGRLTATFDYYIKTTEDLLLSRQLPTYTGFNSIIDNVGSVRNKGIELTLGGDPFVGDFRWNTSFNISANKSEVLDLGGLSSLPFRTTPGAGYGFSTNNNTALLYFKTWPSFW
jgi:outer membrane receptor protein involved in Fe transport